MTASESDVCELFFPKYGFGIDKFLSYRANSHFTCPSDGFEFVVAGSSLDSTTREALRRGELFKIIVNGHTQAEGYIDRVSSEASRESGTIIRIEGSDKLAQVVRAGIDPRVRFQTSQTLLDILVKVFEPFGYTADSFRESNDANRDIKSGQVRGQKLSVTHSKKRTTVKPLKSYTLHQTKPYHGEGAFAFASRLSQRFGLWIWLSAEGDILIVSRPNFDQPPRYRLYDKLDGNTRTTNIEHGHVIEDASQQPSCIVATGFSADVNADCSRYKVIVINELVGLGDDGFAVPSVQKIIADNPDASQLPPRADAFAKTAIKAHPAAQPIYLHDQESQTLEQLQNYARRELALKQHHSLRATYVVEGHSQDDTIWAVDTIVDVDDDIRDIHEPLYVLGRTFEKSRDGTRTTLELIRPWTLDFGSFG